MVLLPSAGDRVQFMEDSKLKSVRSVSSFIFSAKRSEDRVRENSTNSYFAIFLDLFSRHDPRFLNVCVMLR